MSNLLAKEDELFHEWRSLEPNLVRDGAVDAGAYIESSLRILLIMKETNDLGGGGWDLRTVLHKAEREPTWHTVSRWLCGVEALPSELHWSQLNNIEINERQRLLRTIAVMNLKKTLGGNTANAKKIAGAAKARADLLRRQYTLYDPNLIVCCGTGDWVDPIVSPEDPSPNWCQTSRGIHYRNVKKSCVMVDFSHPAARCKTQLLTYGLIDAIREIGVSDLRPKSV